VKTLTVDDHQRVRLPDVKPRQVFAHEKGPGGQIILTPIEPHSTKVRLMKKNGYTVAVTDHPITQEQVRQALDEFP
jgi:hypothetical protein